MLAPSSNADAVVAPDSDALCSNGRGLAVWLGQHVASKADVGLRCFEQTCMFTESGKAG